MSEQARNKNYMLYDKFPKSIKNATSTSDGLMSSEDKSRLDSIFEFGLLTPATENKDGIMAKEDKIKLDGIEENANNYIHPDTPDIRHVSDAEKSKWNNQIKYTNSKPTPIDVGGVEKGTTFDNIDYKDLFTKILYPYIDPTISNIVMTPATTILEKGNTFRLTRIRFNIATPSLQDSDVLTYNFKKNNNQFHSVVTANRSIDTTFDTGINDDTSITVQVIDNINKKEKDFTLITYRFIYPIYYGIINSSDTVIDALIRSKTKLLQQKGTKTLKFTTDNQKMLFAYPKSYGKLTAIYDANNFNVMNTFNLQEVSVIGNDLQYVSYYVYINDLSTVSNYDMKFVF